MAGSRRSGTAVTVLLAILFVVGCPEKADHESASLPAPTPGALRVAIVLPGSHDDHDWNQSGFDGLQLIAKDLGAHVAYAENVTEARSKDVFRRFAREGYDLVIGHGGEYVEEAEIVANEFPRIKFALVALYPGNSRNLGAVRFRETELGYLTGAVAALRSRTNQVAYVGGMPFRHLQEQAAAFALGARSIKPDIQVHTHWLGDWTHVERARAAARDLIASGVDVLSVNAERAGRGVFEEAQASRVFVIGWNLDQYPLAPEAVVTSGIQRIPVVLLEAARLVKQGRWEGKQYRFGLREGAQDLAPFRGMLSDEDVQRVNRLRSDLLSGDIRPRETLMREGQLP